MIQTLPLREGVLLRHCSARHFKKSAVSIQLLRPMCPEEAAKNALLPAVLLRGCEKYPDLRAITWHLDELYGTSVSTMVRRIGDIQTVGLYCSFIEDRFAPEGEPVLASVVDFLRQLLLEPLLREGCFLSGFVDSEKRNLISTIESELNDKRSYASARMLRAMCPGDSFAVPRLGEPEDVAAITSESLYAHYRHILAASPVEIFYVGSAEPGQVARLLQPLARCLAAQAQPLPAQTLFRPQAPRQELFEEMDIAQAKLSMGFTCPVRYGDSGFAAMQVFNTLYGGGMTSKLFMNVREKLSLCYYASSAYYGSKGILTVSCGIDQENYRPAKEEILSQLSACQNGQISPSELLAAKSALLSSLRATPDSPGALEGYYATGCIGGLDWDLAQYMAAIEAVTAEDVVDAARKVKLHTTFCLKGVGK